MFENISLLGLLIAAVASMAVGFVWYGPLFGKAWMDAAGFSEKDIEDAKKKDMGSSYFISFLGAVVMAWVLAMFINFTGAKTPVQGAMTGFWAWLGFVATTQLANTLFKDKNMKLYYLTAAHHLATLLVMGAILTWF